MTNMDAFWAGAKQLGEQMMAEAAAKREAARDARNARRRARYARMPKPARKPKATVVVDVESELDEGCRCNVTPMPPCGWCENGGGE